MVPTALMASIRGSWSSTCSPPTADMTISISCSFNIFSISSLSLTVPCNTNKKWQKSYLKNVSKSHSKMKRNNHENHVQRTRNKKAPLSLNASTILALLQELPGLGRTRTQVGLPEARLASVTNRPMKPVAPTTRTLLLPVVIPFDTVIFVFSHDMLLYSPYAYRG